MTNQSIRDIQKQKTRAVILKMATNSFREKGFQKTTLREIAKSSNVATGTIFVHFTDKFDLLAQILFEELDSCIRAAWKSLPQDTDLLHQLTFLIEKVYQFYFRDSELSRILLKEGIYTANTGEDILGQQVLEFLMKVANLFEVAKTKREIRDDLSTKVLCHTYFSVYLTILSKFLKQKSPSVDEAVLEFKEIFGEVLRWGRIKNGVQ